MTDPWVSPSQFVDSCDGALLRFVFGVPPMRMVKFLGERLAQMPSVLSPQIHAMNLALFVGIRRTPLAVQPADWKFHLRSLLIVHEMRRRDTEVAMA